MLSQIMFYVSPTFIVLRLMQFYDYVYYVPGVSLNTLYFFSQLFLWQPHKVSSISQIKGRPGSLPKSTQLVDSHLLRDF